MWSETGRQTPDDPMAENDDKAGFAAFCQRLPPAMLAAVTVLVVIKKYAAGLRAASASTNPSAATVSPTLTA